MKLKKRAFQPGVRVKWSGDDTGPELGIIRKVFTHRLERTINGETVVRPANRRNPAYLIEQEDGDQLLKNHNELIPA